MKTILLVGFGILYWIITVCGFIACIYLINKGHAKLGYIIGIFNLIQSAFIYLINHIGKAGDELIKKQGRS